MYFQYMGEYRKENFKHLFSDLMGEWACQLQNLDSPSWGREPTRETIFTLIANP